MTALKEKLARRIRRWLPRLLPSWLIGMAWYEMAVTRLAALAGSGG